MTSPILIDANVPIYAMGSEHRLKPYCGRILGLAIEFPRAFFTDAEVHQEIMHRSMALNRWADVRPYFTEFLNLMSGRIEPMYGDDVAEAANLADDHPGLAARDLLHLAVMRRIGSTQIATADRGFDSIDGIERLDPARVDDWQALVTGAASP